MASLLSGRHDDGGELRNLRPFGTASSLKIDHIRAKVRG
jgi:hypothetical protein